MTNKFYAKGRSFEYRIMNMLVKRGLVVFRTPASGKKYHVDLIVINVKRNKIACVECKYHPSRSKPEQVVIKGDSVKKALELCNVLRASYWIVIRYGEGYWIGGIKDLLETVGGNYRPDPEKGYRSLKEWIISELL